MELSQPKDQDEAERRLAKIKLEQLDDYEAAIRHAEHVRLSGPDELASLSGVLAELEARRHKLNSQSGGHLSPRVRAKQRWARWDPGRPRAWVFIDETGLTKGRDPNAPTFATAAVIVRAEDYGHLAARIHNWQETWFGRRRYVHELDIRKGTGPFHFDGDAARRSRAFQAYCQLLEDLPYRVVTVVIEKDQLARIHPDGRIDGYLPNHLYPLAIQMLFERVVHALHADDDRLGLVEAEGIGQTEDALLQQAFAALKLRGTRFLQDGWFRYQLRDHVEFFGKAHNRPGLQLADWVVKPIADAVACARDQIENQDRIQHLAWARVQPHIYDGTQQRPDKFGLKVYPSAPHDMRAALFPGIPVGDPVDWTPDKAQGPTARAVDP